MDRRQVLKAAGLSVATLALSPLHALAQKEAAGYTLPKLPYGYDALEPSIDAETMKIHHGKHHQAYINNANMLLKGEPKLLAMPVDELLADVSKVPEKIRQGVINNAGGHSNHSIFWEVMGPKGGKGPSGALSKAIDGKFGSLDTFQKEFSTKAVTQFGSGWAWLVVNKKGELEIVQRANQNSPIMDGLKPVLGIDVWEHAYYLKYKNLRPDYVKAWWNVVNWAAVADRYAAAVK
jgi:Fe-Mn family superoxide dismutase